jgi:uncharacterized protein with NRDE domain
MCLVLVALRAHPELDLLLAGNRDEFYRRASAPPAVISRDPVIHAGLDREAGGTWMGRNEAGLVAALTNRRDPAFVASADLRSRGDLVLGLLRQRDPERAARWLMEQPLERFRPFSVLFGTAAAFYAFSPAEGGEPRRLAPGFHALSNSALNDRAWPKVERSLRFLESRRGVPGERLIEDVQRFLCDATPPDALPGGDPPDEVHGAMGAVFIRTPAFGTVSASILTAGGKLGGRYYYADAADMAAFGEGGPAPFRQLDFPA